MKTEEESKLAVEKFAQENLNKRNKSPNSELNNAALVQQIGGSFSGAGVKDVDQKADAPGNAIDENTMFAEGSIGKVRYAGLAYMMQEDDILDLQKNALEFFSTPEVGKLLEEKYPKKDMQKAIQGLFTNGSEKATIADLTTHRSGIGDTTADTLNREKKTNGADHDYSLPDFVLPNEYSVVPRDKETSKPQAKKGLKGDLAPAVYGDHEYSNLGYQILAEAMELAYEMKAKQDGKEPDKARKTYQTLTEDFMLHPIEGPAVGKGLSFDRTMFPRTEKFAGDANVVQAKLLQDPSQGADQARQVNGFNGAGAAGGIFTSASDSAKFFTEYFKGFPGTEEYGQEGFDGNPFFSQDTIERMTVEALKHKSAANQPMIDKKTQELQEWQKGNSLDLENSQDRPVIPNPTYQFPGVTLTTDPNGEPRSYAKGGGTPGYISGLSFTPANGENAVDVSMIHQENVTPAREKELAESLRTPQAQSFVEKYAPDRQSSEALDSFVQRMADRASQAPPPEASQQGESPASSSSSVSNSGSSPKEAGGDIVSKDGENEHGAKWQTRQGIGKGLENSRSTGQGGGSR